jgi:uncharacterized protein (DUF433 family)
MASGPKRSCSNLTPRASAEVICVGPPGIPTDLGTAQPTREPGFNRQFGALAVRSQAIEVEELMPKLTRITRDARVMGGKPCIRGMRVTVGTVVGLVAAGHTTEEILRQYPYLEAADVAEALSYAAWRAAEVEVPLGRQ